MIKAVRFILSNFAAILAAIELVETLSDEQTSGESKKMLVLDAILDTANRVGLKPNRITITILSKTIDTLVAVLNQIDWGEKLEGWLVENEVDKTLVKRRVEAAARKEATR